MSDQMRRNGINDKQVFYCRRYSEPQLGSYFEYRLNKEVCNPNDRYPFYLKLGGVVFLPKKKVPGKKIASSAERIKESEYFGSYLYFGDTDRKLRTILYARRKCMPGGKLVSIPGVLHSVIPRYDGIKKDKMIIGMKVTAEEKTSSRLWNKFDSNPTNDIGLYDITGDQDILDLNRAGDFEPSIMYQNPTIGIYVPENTSALIVDVTRPHLYSDFNRHYVYTLCQSGAFICVRTKIWFCFYDEDEGQEYDITSLMSEKRHKLNETKNLDFLINKNDDDDHLDRILVLKSAPNYTFWTFRVIREWRGWEIQFQICIPSGAQFDEVFSWDEGVAEVMRRHALKPWNKYMEYREPIGGNNIIPRLSNINLYLDQVYPQDH